MTAALEALDRRLMDLALRVARRGRPSPNPHVGAVIARGAEIVSVGHHVRAGLGHAEVNALAAAGEAARGATLYVTLEPCNHHGRTPPCTEAILAAGIARVVVGCLDPKPHVPGASARLRAAGVEVRTGVHEVRARRLVADFARHIETGLPWVRLKAAVSLDGRMATETGDSKWITGERARREGHRLRDRSDAVLVGVGTVLADDPELTVRLVRGVDPLRVVLDPQLRTPPTAKVLVGPARTLILHAEDAPSVRRAALAREGVELVTVARSERGLALGAVLRELGSRDVVRLLVEGGPTVQGALLAEGLADSASVFVAPRIVGSGPVFGAHVGAQRIAEAWRLTQARVRSLGGDVLIEGDLERPR